jgi:hypothetical protein
VRALRYGVRLSWGRDGSVPRVHPSRFSVAERSIDYPRWDIFGRQIIDTYFLLLFHDVGARDLESYGLKNAAIPVVTVLGLQVRRLLGGTVIVEQIFAMNGVGQLAVRAVFLRDLPVLLGVALITAVVVLLINLLVDMSYGYFDPKVRA